MLLGPSSTSAGWKNNKQTWDKKQERIQNEKLLDVNIIFLHFNFCSFQVKSLQCPRLKCSFSLLSSMRFGSYSSPEMGSNT